MILEIAVIETSAVSDMSGLLVAKLRTRFALDPEFLTTQLMDPHDNHPATRSYLSVTTEVHKCKIAPRHNL